MINSKIKEYFFENKQFLIATVIFLGIILMAIFAPFFATHDPIELGKNPLLPPSINHFFGTDDFGRDIFSRILYGARISLTVGFIAVLISVVVGFLFGIIAGFFGGWVDFIIMRFVDVMLSFPSIFLILAIQTMLKPNIYNVMVVIGLTSWMGVARLVRAEVLSVKERPFIDSVKVLGIPKYRILFRHILPNVLEPVFVAATISMAGAILTESALSFLGLGVQPPTPSWGNMLQDSQAYLRDAPWMALIPGAFIFVTVLSIYFIGEGLKEALQK